jgi:uncharacterized membrane protein
VTDPAVPPIVPFPHPQLPDRAYVTTTRLLRGGLLVSLSILGASLAAYLLTHPGDTSGSAISSNPILQYLSLGGFAHGLAAGSPEVYLTLGIFVLIATPILRVTAGLYYFHQGREKQMVAVTFTVLVLLILGLLVIGPLLR